MLKHIEPIFLDQTYDFLRRTHGRTPPKGPSRAKLKQALQKYLQDKTAFTSLTFDNSGISSCVLAKATLNQFQQPIVDGRLFYFPPGPQRALAVDLVLAKLSDKFAARPCRHLEIEVSATDTGMLELLAARGFAPWTYLLLGDIGDALDYLAGCETSLPHGYALRLMSYDQDIEQVVRLERAAHRADPTSVVHRHISSPSVDTRALYRKLCQAPAQVWVLTHTKRDRIVGVMSFSPFRDDPQAAMIFTVAVSPRHQGQGLGNVLYRHSLAALRRLGCRRYIGWTAIERVLSHATKLGRRVTGVALRRPL